jgi:hypothetical protein
MPNEDSGVNSPQPRRAALLGVFVILAILAVGATLLTLRTLRDHERSSEASSNDGPDPQASSPTTTIESEAEVITRLREILAVREAAYRKRDPELLRGIYTVDCPCIESDSNAIRELIREDYVWVGGGTSIQVRRSERVTSKMWIVIADFSSEPLRIQTESGRTVRNEPRGSDTFQFVLAKPAGSTHWLLGRATSFDDD